MSSSKRTARPKRAESYEHPQAESPMRPDVGTQAQFRKKKQPQTYRYDSSLSPALDWDEQNPAREQGEAYLATIQKELAALRKEASSADNYDEIGWHLSEAEEAA